MAIVMTTILAAVGSLRGDEHITRSQYSATLTLALIEGQSTRNGELQTVNHDISVSIVEAYTVTDKLLGLLYSPEKAERTITGTRRFLSYTHFGRSRPATSESKSPFDGQTVLYDRKKGWTNDGAQVSISNEACLWPDFATIASAVPGLSCKDLARMFVPLNDIFMSTNNGSEDVGDAELRIEFAPLVMSLQSCFMNPEGTIRSETEVGESGTVLTYDFELRFTNEVPESAVLLPASVDLRSHRHSFTIDGEGQARVQLGQDNSLEFYQIDADIKAIEKAFIEVAKNNEERPESFGMHCEWSGKLNAKLTCQ